MARVAIGASLVEIRSPYNDGWTSSACKRELYLLKSWLDEEYEKLPTFQEEEQWEKELMWDRLKETK
jgi:pyruvate/2-oxoacid:ferredoxin oxidoreductase beta subunit